MGVFGIFLAFIILVAFLLIVVIMVQNPKGGGLSSSFGGGTQQIGGVKKTGDFLDKSTWALAGLLLVLILVSNTAIGGNSQVTESKALDTDAVEKVDSSVTPNTESQNNEDSNATN